MFTAVILVALGLCYWRVEDLVVLVQTVAAMLEQSEYFDRLRTILEGR